MRRVRFRWLLGAAVAALSISTVVPARAQPTTAQVDHPQSPQTETPPIIADFEGRKIDLAKDWGAARACLVWRQGGVVECFRTNQALDAREQQLSPQRQQPKQAGTGAASGTAAASFSCSSSLNLYEHSWYGGRRVSYWDRGFWQNLSGAGFDNKMSSYVTGGCYAHLAENAWGGGWWYPGYTGPYYGEGWLSAGWDNRVSSIYLE